QRKAGDASRWRFQRIRPLLRPLLREEALSSGFDTVALPRWSGGKTRRRVSVLTQALYPPSAAIPRPRSVLDKLLEEIGRVRPRLHPRSGRRLPVPPGIVLSSNSASSHSLADTLLPHPRLAKTPCRRSTGRTPPIQLDQSSSLPPKAKPSMPANARRSSP